MKLIYKAAVEMRFVLLGTVRGPFSAQFDWPLELQETGAEPEAVDGTRFPTIPTSNDGVEAEVSFGGKGIGERFRLAPNAGRMELPLTLHVSVDPIDFEIDAVLTTEASSSPGAQFDLRGSRLDMAGKTLTLVHAGRFQGLKGVAVVLNGEDYSLKVAGTLEPAP